MRNRRRLGDRRAVYLYRITDAGRERALLFLENNHYVGAAPVPLAQYVAYLNAYREAMPRTITRTACGARSAISC